MEEEVKDIYKLELHEIVELSRNCYVRRVAGGWIYFTKLSECDITSCFVPYDNEFQEK